jgi:hypothetical protein
LEETTTDEPLEETTNPEVTDPPEEITTTEGVAQTTAYGVSGLGLWTSIAVSLSMALAGPF